MGVRLYVGGDAYSVQGRRVLLTGDRMFSAAVRLRSRLPPEKAHRVNGLLDSGAFSDPPERRLDPVAALDRQLSWEENTSKIWDAPWQAEAVVSYDLLIDEKWTAGRRRKERWTVAEADQAVRVTVEAAAYLAAQRQRIAPRGLMLACQGVDATQYEECVRGVLLHARPGDILGLGGWCVLGLMRSWLPEFWATLRRCLPLIARSGINRVHIFGVLWPKALGGLLWLADQLGLAVSTDSSAPLLQTSWSDLRKAGALAPTWEANVQAWRARLASLRGSPEYRQPPELGQPTFWRNGCPNS